mmetsp:Transcript_47476/g.85447  ORF Transcript_47476/g.85447 Transcript_47476/m.85447 type:complete len:242 (+) Transcript_47476:254-979(+)
MTLPLTRSARPSPAYETSGDTSSTASWSPSTTPPASPTHFRQRALTIALALSGLSVAVPGAFFTGANSSSRLVSRMAMRLLMAKQSKTKASSLMPLLLSGWTVFPSSPAKGIFLCARWNIVAILGMTTSARKSTAKKWLQIFPAPKTRRPLASRWFFLASSSSLYSTTPERPPRFATTPTFSSGLDFQTHLLPQSAFLARQYPMNLGSAGRQRGLSTEKTWRLLTPAACRRAMQPLFCKAG